jgi:hypothetical protein
MDQMVVVSNTIDNILLGFDPLVWTTETRYFQVRLMRSTSAHHGNPDMSRTHCTTHPRDGNIFGHICETF